MYDLGYGMAQNFEKTTELYKKSVAKTMHDACCNLTILYEKGTALDKIMTRRQNCMAKSAPKMMRKHAVVLKCCGKRR
jgi:TPR repeat protein